ncbi:MAG: class I tRNA ligase family protein, partial [bacterium]
MFGDFKRSFQIHPAFEQGSQSLAVTRNQDLDPDPVEHRKLQFGPVAEAPSAGASQKYHPRKNHHHQYPHCWRSKSPVIFRAMDQWFVSLDQDDLRGRCIDGLKDVSFTPDWGRNRIHGFLESRPDWCISRQRSWGVPIPVFFDEDGNALLDSKLINFLANKISKD